VLEDVADPQPCVREVSRMLRRQVHFLAVKPTDGGDGLSA